jgi:hypothetical protein
MKRDENTEWYISHVLKYGTDLTQNIPVGEYLDWWTYRHIDEELVALGYPADADDWTDADWDKLQEGVRWAEDYIHKQIWGNKE